jgi:hypothetical protein
MTFNKKQVSQPRWRVLMTKKEQNNCIRHVLKIQACKMLPKSAPQWITDFCESMEAYMKSERSR